MARLRRLSLRCVWGVLLPFALSCQVPCYLILANLGWPRKPWTELDHWSVVGAYTLALGLSNLPDLASIGLFIAMRCHFGTNNSVQPMQDGGGHQGNPENDAGGIWMGGNGDFPLQHLGESASSESSKANADAEQHEAEAVMRILRRHAALSLLDVAGALVAAFYCHPAGKAAAYIQPVLSGIWVPFLTIKGCFHQMKDFGKCSWCQLG